MRTGFIDWTEGKLSLYVFEKKGRQYALVDTVSVTFEGELNQSLLTSIAKTNIEHIYLSVPSNLLSLRELTLPFSDTNKIRDTIPFEIEGILLGSTNDYSIDCLVKETSESGSLVLAACMEKSRLRDIIDMFSSVGLEPAAITSIDLRLSGGNVDMLFESPVPGEEIRAEAAGEELTNLSINLRQGELAYKGDVDRIKKSLRTTGILVFILLMILGAYTATKFMSVKKETALLTNKMNTMYQDVFPEDTKIVDVVRQFKGNLNVLREKKTILGGAPVLDTLLNIANLKNKDITLSEFSVDREKTIIKGTAQSFENIDSLKNALLSSFAEVRVIDSTSSPDKKISFSIIMKEKTS